MPRSTDQPKISSFWRKIRNHRVKFVWRGRLAIQSSLTISKPTRQKKEKPVKRRDKGSDMV